MSFIIALAQYVILELKKQKQKMKNESVNWIDIHKNPDEVAQIDENLEFVRERLHVIDRNGKKQVGINAAISILNSSPKETMDSENIKPTYYFTHNGFTL